MKRKHNEQPTDAQLNRSKKELHKDTANESDLINAQPSTSTGLFDHNYAKSSNTTSDNADAKSSANQDLGSILFRILETPSDLFITQALHESSDVRFEYLASRCGFPVKKITETKKVSKMIIPLDDYDSAINNICEAVSTINSLQRAKEVLPPHLRCLGWKMCYCLHYRHHYLHHRHRHIQRKRLRLVIKRVLRF